MEVAGSSAVLVTTYQPTQSDNPADHIVYLLFEIFSYRLLQTVVFWNMLYGQLNFLLRWTRWKVSVLWEQLMLEPNPSWCTV